MCWSKSQKTAGPQRCRSKEGRPRAEPASSTEKLDQRNTNELAQPMRHETSRYQSCTRMCGRVRTPLKEHAEQQHTSKPGHCRILHDQNILLREHANDLRIQSGVSILAPNKIHMSIVIE